MGEPKKRVLLRDVAERAGVSLGTASTALANKSSVSREAREAVQAAALDLGYSPIRRRSGKFPINIGLLGMVIRSMKVPVPANPFYSHLLYGTQRACADVEISLTYEVVEEQLPLMVRRRQAAGLLLVGYFDPAYIADVQSVGLPLVMVDHRIESLPIDSICNDDESGGYIATQYLINNGHQSPPPAMIGGPLTHASIKARLNGYHRALAEAGLQYDEQYIRIGDLGVSSGFTEMCVLLDLEKPPTAVFCCNDLTALGALNALHERGVHVPDECSVVGYDDIDAAVHSVPPLTTVRVDKELLGAQGVWHLLERIRFPEMPSRDTRLAVRLVERKSVGRPRHFAAGKLVTGSDYPYAKDVSL